MIFIDKIRKQKYPTQHYLTLNILFLFENMSNYKVMVWMQIQVWVHLK